MQSKLWTLSGLAVELGHDRRTLASRLDGLAPDEESQLSTGRTSRKWRMARAVAHLYASANPGELDLNAERARLAKEQADKTAMANAVERGELLSAQTVALEWGRLVSNCRAKLLGLPTKLAPQLAHAKTPNACLQLLTSEVHRALHELAEYRPGDEPQDTEGRA